MGSGTREATKTAGACGMPTKTPNAARVTTATMVAGGTLTTPIAPVSAQQLMRRQTAVGAATIQGVLHCVSACPSYAATYGRCACVLTRVTFRCSTDNCFAEYIAASPSDYAGIADIALIDGCTMTMMTLIDGAGSPVVIIIVVLAVCCLLGIGALVAKKKSVPAPAPAPIPQSSYSGTNTAALAPTAHPLVSTSPDHIAIAVATPTQASGNASESLQARLEGMKMPDLRKLAESSGITKDAIEVRFLTNMWRC